MLTRARSPIHAALEAWEAEVVCSKSPESGPLKSTLRIDCAIWGHAWILFTLAHSASPSANDPGHPSIQDLCSTAPLPDSDPSSAKHIFGRSFTKRTPTTSEPLNRIQARRCTRCLMDQSQPPISNKVVQTGQRPAPRASMLMGGRLRPKRSGHSDGRCGSRVGDQEMRSHRRTDGRRSDAIWPLFARRSVCNQEGKMAPLALPVWKLVRNGSDFWVGAQLTNGNAYV